MVAFIKPISNAQMVEALNDLIHLNYDLATSYDTAVNQSPNPDQRERLSELKAMHGRHIDMLANQVRVLGGAPVSGQDWRQWVMRSKVRLAAMGKGEKLLSVVQANEESLQGAYREVLGQFAASEEMVDVINNVVDDGRDLREELKQVVSRKEEQ